MYVYVAPPTLVGAWGYGGVLSIIITSGLCPRLLVSFIEPESLKCPIKKVWRCAPHAHEP